MFFMAQLPLTVRSQPQKDDAIPANETLVWSGSIDVGAPTERIRYEGEGVTPINQMSDFTKNTLL